MSQPEVKPLTRVAFLVDNCHYARKGCNYWTNLGGNHDGADKACRWLEKRNFECSSLKKNATGEDLQCLAGRMAKRLRNTHRALALMVYGGHAMMYKGRLYLIPTDHADRLPGRQRWFLAGLLLVISSSVFAALGLPWLMHQAGLVMLATQVLGWGALALWFVRATWHQVTWHPLSNAYCLDHLEAELAGIHVIHKASNATILLVLDCCRDYGRLSCWHRFLLHLTCDKPLVVERSRRTSRPNFFKTFACEDGFQALGPPFDCGYLTQAFLQALKTLRPGGSLDELLTTMDQNVRESCSGLQKICVYSTSYRLSKQIIFWDEQADVVAVPTLLTMRKDHLLSLKPSELRLFHRHRQTSDPKERKEIFLLPTLSDDLRAMLLLRSLADKKSARGRSSKRMCWKEIHGHIMTTNGNI